MKNDYEVRGNVTAIIINSPKHGRMEILIDTEDLPRAQEFPNAWCAIWSPSTRGFYCMGTIRKNRSRSNIIFHRWITNAPKGKCIDHFNHDTLDNRRENLRIATNLENSQNKKGRPKNNTSGVMCVHWCKDARKWRALLRVNRKRHHLGYFENIHEAESAVIDARAKLMPFSQEAAVNN